MAESNSNSSLPPSRNAGKHISIGIPTAPYKDQFYLAVEMDKYSLDPEEEYHHSMVLPINEESIDLIAKEIKRWLGILPPSKT